MIGGDIATSLRSAWRQTPDPIGLRLRQLCPCIDNLVRSGAGAIVWQRLESAEWRSAPSLDALRRAHHIDRIRAALNVRHVEAVIAGMRSAGIDTILLKGWSAASAYADPALRPLGDIDLLVREADGARARQEVETLARNRPPIDLHTALLDLTDRTVVELFARSRMIPLGDTEVRVLGREDQLRHLCLHFFRHAGSRPLWLCDIAATLEAMPHDFDWELCLTGDPLLTERVVAAVGLAEMLLGARPTRPIPARWREPMPAWLPRAVVRNWGSAFDPRIFRPTAMSLALDHPREILPALMRRWPNPLEATVHRSASIAGRWRAFIQLEEAAVRAIRFVRSGAFMHAASSRRAAAR